VSGSTSQNGAVGSADPALVKLVEEVTARLHDGGPVDVDLLAGGNTEHATWLRELLPALRLLGDGNRSGDADLTPPDGPAEQGEGGFGVLGDFRIIREVGRGGMGVVFEAEQVSLGRRVALKVLPFAAALDPRQLQRFKTEAQAAAQLQHGHIVPVHFVGSERGVHYYAMQFIDGRTLAAVIDELRRRTGGSVLASGDRDGRGRRSSVVAARHGRPGRPGFGIAGGGWQVGRAGGAWPDALGCLGRPAHRLAVGAGGSRAVGSVRRRPWRDRRADTGG
jgi:hypothetical protein